MLPILQYTVIERAADTHQQPLSLEQICAISARAFGAAKEIATIQELAGGDYNNTYLITFTDALKVILRVAPAPDRLSPGRGIGLMRNEHYFQPFFASISSLMPRTLLADFTHQLIDRDYIFQSFMEGERWSAVAEQLSPEENTALWQQLGDITKNIHSVEGDFFGSPILGDTSDEWSTYIIDELSEMIRDIESAEVDASDIRTLRDLAEQHRDLLDEVQEPRLLHGDLWTYNLLIKRDQEGPRISAVLDADGCTWGDPLAEWMMFLFHIKTEASIKHVIEGAQAFWQAYGQPERSKGVRFRELLYRARPYAGLRMDHYLEGNNEQVLRTYEKIRAIIAALQDIVL